MNLDALLWIGLGVLALCELLSAIADHGRGQQIRDLEDQVAALRAGGTAKPRRAQPQQPYPDWGTDAADR